MRRHRAFVATGAAVPPAPTSASADGDDLPVLTEIVGDDGDAEAPSTRAESRLINLDSLLHERLSAIQPRQRELLRRELATWLDEQLPQLVMRVLDGVTDQLVAHINTQARVTLLPRLQAALDNEDAPSVED